MSKLADYLRRFMVQHNLTYADVHQRTGVRQSTLSDIINKNVEPRMSTLQRLAEGLGLSFNDLVQLSGFDLGGGAGEGEADRQLRYLTPDDKQFLLDEMSPDELRDLIDYARKQRRRRLPEP